MRTEKFTTLDVVNIQERYLNYFLLNMSIFSYNMQKVIFCMMSCQDLEQLSCAFNKYNAEYSLSVPLTFIISLSDLTLMVMKGNCYMLHMNI